MTSLLREKHEEIGEGNLINVNGVALSFKDTQRDQFQHCYFCKANMIFFPNVGNFEKNTSLVNFT